MCLPACWVLAHLLGPCLPVRCLPTCWVLACLLGACLLVGCFPTCWGTMTFSASNLPPRAHSAYFRTIWNGLCSERRLQTHIKGCRLGCGGDAEDSIEHYVFCPVVLEFFRRTHIPLTNHSFSAFLCLSPEGKEGEPLVRMIAIYAVYKAKKVVSHSRLTNWDFQRLLIECSKSAVIDDSRNGRWLTFYQSGFRSQHPDTFAGVAKRKANTNSLKCPKKYKRLDSKWG